jgi:hypothetical protein
MEYASILQCLAPCGLSCEKCMGYAKGRIREHAERLSELLGDFGRYAEKFSVFLPVFKNYPAFKEMLEHFRGADCAGCRKGSCKYPNCGVSACFRRKGVDFCFQCDEFPCEKTNFDPDLKDRWVLMNTRMREIGIEKYYEETKDLPRYR